MKREAVIAAIVLMSVSLLFPVSAEPLQEGMAAYEAGRFGNAIEIWLPLAEQGNSVAQYMVGHMHMNGEGVIANEDTGARWYRQAADQGLREARFALGEVYEKRWRRAVASGREENITNGYYRQGLLLYRQAVRQGHGLAKGRIVAMERDLKRNGSRLDEEINPFLVAGGVGVFLCMALFGLLMRRWRRREEAPPLPDPEEVRRFEQVYSCAIRAEVDAQCELGRLYLTGVGVARDAGKAVGWFRKAADRDHPGAQCALGFCYANGDGVGRDHGLAVNWLRKAAENGDPAAQHELGMKYLRGEGVREDFQQLVFWLEKAADQGYTPAQTELGILYRDGAGAALATEQALSMITYRSGEGIPEDHLRALHWLGKAASSGDALAQLNLGDMYMKGQGTTPDRELAIRWYIEAARNGSEEAAAKLPSRDVSTTLH